MLRGGQPRGNFQISPPGDRHRYRPVGRLRRSRRENETNHKERRRRYVLQKHEKERGREEGLYIQKKIFGRAARLDPGKENVRFHIRGRLAQVPGRFFGLRPVLETFEQKWRSCDRRLYLGIERPRLGEAARGD